MDLFIIIMNDNKKLKKKQFNHEYYLKNKEKIKAQSKAYRAKNKEKVNEWFRQYYKNNKEYILFRRKQNILKTFGKINDNQELDKLKNQILSEITPKLTQIVQKELKKNNK